MYFSVNWQSFVRRHWKANLSRATMERSRRGVLLGAALLKYLIVISSREVQDLRILDPCSARNWIIPFRRQQQRIPLTVARLGRGVDWLIRGSIRSGKPRKCFRQCGICAILGVRDVCGVRWSVGVRSCLWFFGKWRFRGGAQRVMDMFSVMYWWKIVGEKSLCLKKYMIHVMYTKFINSNKKAFVRLKFKTKLSNFMIYWEFELVRNFKTFHISVCTESFFSIFFIIFFFRGGNFREAFLFQTYFLSACQGKFS